MKEFLRTIRLLDEQGNLSITNLSVLAALVNVAVQWDVDIYDVVALGITLASYQYKRVVEVKRPAPVNLAAELQAQITQLETKLAAVAMGRRPQ